LDTIVEKELQKMPIVDYATIKNLLRENGYKYINDKINYMKQKGLLSSLKKGLYLYHSPYIQTFISNEIIANNLLGPSYISYEYALSYYNLIPERVEEISSVTTKRSKAFSTEYGVYSYTHMKKELFTIGINILSSKQGNFMIASKEKALCDKIYALKGVKIRSKKAMREFLLDDLRIDFDEIDSFDLELIKKYMEISKSQRIKFLYQIIEEVK